MNSNQITSTSIEETSSEEKTRLTDLMQKAYIPAISIATITEKIISESKSEFNIQSCSLGIADTSSEEKALPETPFWACSLSKPVFAYLVIKLSCKDKLGENFLDEPLPWDEKELGPQGDKQLLTPRMILSHQTGLPNEGPPKFQFKPNEGFFYSGVGYRYLQKIIEKQMNNTPLKTLAKREVFDPLEMHHSTFLSAEAKNTAKTHDNIQQPLSTGTDNNNAAASLHTTANDYARFVIAFFQEPFFSKMIQSQISMEKDIEAKSIPQDNLKQIDWGIGIGLEKTNDQKIIRAFHWGHGPGERAFFVTTLTHPRSAVVYLANSENGLAITEDVVKPHVGDIKPIMQFLSGKYGYRRWDSEGWIEYHAALNQAVTAEKKEEYTKAIQHYQEAVKMRPEDKALLYRIQWVEVQQRLQSHTEVKPNPAITGKYGPLTISMQENIVQISDGGVKRNLMVVDENTFVDEFQNNKVILKLNQGSLSCHFPNGQIFLFPKMMPTVEKKEDSLTQIAKGLKIPPSSLTPDNKTQESKQPEVKNNDSNQQQTESTPTPNDKNTKNNSSIISKP